MNNSNIAYKLINIFQQLNDKLVILYSETAKSPNTDNVHDLRVLIRRLLALADFVQSVMPSNYYKSLRTELKRILKLLNPLRDTQVQLDRVQRVLTSNSPLTAFFFHLLDSENESITNIKKSLTKNIISDVNGLSFFFLLDMKNLLFNVFDLHESIFKICTEAYNQLKATRDATNIGDLDSIHKLRLSFKKYRYTIEIIQRIFDSAHTKNESLKQFQNILGAIQDNNTLTIRFDDFIVKAKKNELSYQQFRNKLIKQRALLIDTLKKNLDLIDKIDFRFFLTQN